MTTLTLLLSALLAAAPLIPNGGFETAIDGRPEGWNASHPDGAKHEYLPTGGRKGSAAVAVTGVDPATMPNFVSAWRQDIEAPPPGEYVFVIWAKGDGLTGPAKFGVLLRDKDKNVLKNAQFVTTPGTFGWKRFVGYLTVTDEHASLQFMVGLARTGGTVTFDDVALVRADQLTKGLGDVRFEPAGPFPINSEQTLRVVWTVGSDGVEPGGGLKVMIPRWRDQRHWQNLTDLKATCSRDGVKPTASLGERQTKVWPPQLIDELVKVTTDPAGPPLVEGDRLELNWKLTTSKTVTEGADFAVQLAPASDGVYLPSGATHRWALTGGVPTNLVITATSAPVPGQPARLTIAAFDDFGNPAPGYTGSITLRAEGQPRDLPATIEIAPEDKGSKRLLVVFPQAGVYHVTAEGPGGLQGVSQPIWVRPADRGGIYFGDLHVHGEASGDAVGPREFTHVFARDYLGLDFASFGDHASGGVTWAPWEQTKEQNAKDRDLPWYETINGYERSFHNGHKNVYFPDDNPDFYGGQDSTDLWGLLGGREALTIPHTPNTDSGGAKRADGTKVWSTMDWGPHNDQYQRVVEIVQTRSSYEQDPIDPDLQVTQGEHGASVQDALAMGHTMGFIGSTDTHDGMPGSKRGWAAIIAPKLERRALWEALRDRRCYATSGVKILLDYRLNDAPLGSEITVPTPTTPRRIHAEVIGTTDLKRLDLIRNGKLFASSEPKGIQATFEGYDDSALEGRTYYYLRVIQQDGQMAWASPVWVDVVGGQREG